MKKTEHMSRALHVLHITIDRQNGAKWSNTRIFWEKIELKRKRRGKKREVKINKIRNRVQGTIIRILCMYMGHSGVVMEGRRGSLRE